ncbi:DUF2303 family protein [Pseudosulfitobacter pseudonitzschiae]|uniref:DUF2303 family protein n=1 Tax=Pseudosulfitobacter pseudonitzschiae TaxID=1402135 RepID=UPI001AF982AF|nr:DUF2303 family protein [Pseudosulfitobacter pseudonitzschiae]MBM1813441.1 DUF2303 family protein [Pseudosulfitobacter pseudonitzschiae]MBM1830434.1 DUF2303 family protein [Pseudosulfitobacter pseudonitzschiae]MBM1835301.1 DUF2303 family protein [Pseudosulfitobacter pseudonitzschiae]MBM1840147.1 DUF2303 family protein [Pseudosulfitobacter pseudonitzschiae]MBM1845865.1 DUF2303 family protein [Pseudosulfitobacter pseudonitzschiae]
MPLTELKEIDPFQSGAETIIELMSDIGHHDVIDIPPDVDLTKPHLVTLPNHRKVENLTAQHIAAAEFFKPMRRTGTARLAHLQSLIDWANRFKSDNSVLYANPDQASPTLTCIADYHSAGPVSVAKDGDPTASHCHHRAVYSFPLSKEWQAWMKISDQPLEKDDMGEFIEANAKDVLDPTPALITLDENAAKEPWETRLIQTARQIEGRYGQLAQLLQMSRQFQVYETSNLTVSSNRDTGETSIQFLDEHKGKDGQPIKIPNLLIIAIPVFEGGAPYRMPVRFRYRKMGGAIRFILSIYNPQRAFDAAFEVAVNTATEETALPVFMGKPEV